MKHFEFELGVAGGRGRGMSNYADSAETGEKIHARPAPSAGVRRILRATPYRPLAVVVVVLCELICLTRFTGSAF